MLGSVPRDGWLGGVLALPPVPSLWALSGLSGAVVGDADWVGGGRGPDHHDAAPVPSLHTATRVFDALTAEGRRDRIDLALAPQGIGKTPVVCDGNAEGEDRIDGDPTLDLDLRFDAISDDEELRGGG
jgi:hypothetical protein